MTSAINIQVASGAGIESSLTVNGTLTMTAGELNLGFNASNSNPHSVNSTLAIGAAGHVTFESSWIYDGWGDVPAGIINTVQIDLASGARLTSDTSGGGFGMRLWSEWSDGTGDGKTWTGNGLDDAGASAASFEGVLRLLYAEGLLTRGGSQSGDFDEDFIFIPGATGADGTLLAPVVTIDDLSTAFGGDNTILQAELAAGQTISGRIDAADGTVINVEFGPLAVTTTASGGIWSVTVDDGSSDVASVVDLREFGDGTVTITASVGADTATDSFELDQAQISLSRFSADGNNIAFNGGAYGIEDTQTVSYTYADVEGAVLDSGTATLTQTESFSGFSGSIPRQGPSGFYTITFSATDTSGQTATVARTVVLFNSMDAGPHFTHPGPLSDQLPFTLDGWLFPGPVDVSVTLTDSTGKVLRAVVSSTDGPGAPVGGAIWSAPHTAFFPQASVIEVETDASNDQDPEMAVLGDGSWVVVWESRTAVGNSSIYQRRFNSDGTPMAAAVELRAATEDYDPSVAALTDGGWIVCVHTGTGIEQIRFASDGTAPGGFGTVASGSVFSPRVIGLTGGGWVVLYQTAPDGEVRFQVYDSAGAAGSLGSFGTTGSRTGHTSIDALPTGGFVIAGALTNATVTDFDIFCQTFDSTGASVSSLLQADSTGVLGYEGKPSVSTLSDGGWIVAWTQIFGTSAVNCQRFTAAGVKVGGIQQVSETGDTFNDVPGALGLPDGGWAILWQQEGSGEEADYVYRFYDSSGAATPTTPALFVTKVGSAQFNADTTPRLLADGSVALPYVLPIYNLVDGGEIRIGTIGRATSGNVLSLLSEGPVQIRVLITDSLGETASSSDFTTLDNSLTTYYPAWALAMGLTPGVNDGLNDVAVPGGKPNILHYAFDTDPFGDGSNEGKIRTIYVGPPQVTELSIILPIRKGAVFNSGTSPFPFATVGDIRYSIRGSFDLQTWNERVFIGTGIPSGLPALRDIDGDGEPDWEYRRFILYPGTSPQGFLQGVVEEMP